MRGRLLDKYSVIVGIAYIFLSLSAFFNAFYYDSAESIFWFCYIGLFLMGMGILLRNPAFIKSQLYILMIPDLVWTIDFFSYIVLNGNSFLGITDYFFAAGRIFPKIITLQHLFTVPLAIFICSKMEIKKDRAWLASSLQLAGIFMLTRVFTPSEKNVNCAYRFCGDFDFSGAFYPLLWIAGGIIMILAAKFILQMVFAFLNKTQPFMTARGFRRATN